MLEKKEALVWLIVILAVSLGFLPMLAWVHWAGHMPMMMGMMGYGWWFLPLFTIVSLVLIALGAYYLITEIAGQGRSYKGAGRSLEILKERYARGEIMREQYLKMKEELES